MLGSTYTHGFIVLKDGVILHEDYFNGMNADTRHLLMSVSKTIAGSLTGCLDESGVLDPNKTVVHYAPEFTT
jgi:CubicO group peptidase (beta-lactamase class C family)